MPVLVKELRIKGLRVSCFQVLTLCDTVLFRGLWCGQKLLENPDLKLRFYINGVWWRGSWLWYTNWIFFGVCHMLFRTLSQILFWSIHMVNVIVLDSFSTWSLGDACHATLSLENLELQEWNINLLLGTLQWRCH